MKITELTNLWVATYDDDYNKFRILVVAIDEIAARELAVEYFTESGIADGILQLLENLIIEQFENINTKFDCDYAIY